MRQRENSGRRKRLCVFAVTHFRIQPSGGGMSTRRSKTDLCCEIRRRNPPCLSSSANLCTKETCSATWATPPRLQSRQRNSTADQECECCSDASQPRGTVSSGFQ